MDFFCFIAVPISIFPFIIFTLSWLRRLDRKYIVTMKDVAVLIDAETRLRERIKNLEEKKVNILMKNPPITRQRRKRRSRIVKQKIIDTPKMTTHPTQSASSAIDTMNQENQL